MGGSSHEEAERQAAAWLSRRDGAPLSAGEQKALEEWLEESSAHAVAFIRLEAAWSRADRFKALGAGFPVRSVPTPDEIDHSPFFDDAIQDAGESWRVSAPPQLQTLVDTDPVADSAGRPAARSRRPSPKWGRLAWAASIAIGVVATLAWRSSLSGTSYSTPIGVTASVPMKDGSRVTLNTDSEIRLEVTDTVRSVRLERGEAFFEVTKDPSRPFIVSAGSRRIVVLGTKFSVRRDGEELRVAVTEGKVRLENESLPSDAGGRVPGGMGADSPVAREGTFVLEAGGVARTDAAGVLVQSKPLSEVQEALSWRTGFLVFRNIDLAQAVAEFNRYSDTKIVVRDHAVAGIRLNGRFKANNFDAFVRLLQDGFPIEVQEREGTLVLTERAQ